LQKNVTVSRIPVRFCDGGTFETGAESASEYLLDSSFIRFLFISLVLYATLLHRDDVAELEPASQMFLWIAMFASTIGWLVFSTSINFALVKRGYVSHLFTPFIVLPVAPISILIGRYVGEFLGAEYWITFPDNVPMIVQNLVALICFDILHGRYVAPAYYAMVSKEKAATAEPVVPAQASAPAFWPSASVSLQTTALDEISKPPAHTDTPRPAPSGAPDASPHAVIELANERIEVRKIHYIKSEGHYLKLQMQNKSMLSRGKLKEVVQDLDHQLGIQISRSVWVSFAEISQTKEDDKGYLEVILKDGSAFKVTSSRRLTFLQNFDRYK